MSWILGSALAIAAGASLSACAVDDGTTGATGDPCPNGICGSGSGGDTSANGSGGSSQSGTGASSSNSTASGPGPCEKWECTPWDTQGNGDDATRTCLQTNPDCTTENGKPTETATLPALDEDYYRCNVEPVLDRTCSQLACHGVEPNLPTSPGRALRTYHRGRLRVTGYIIQGEAGCLNQPDVTSESCIGGVECACWTKPHLPVEWQRNFDAARGFGLAPDGTPYDAGAIDDSDLLAQPLIGGGLVHAGIKMWRDTDTEYETVRDWLLGAQYNGTCTTSN